MSTKIGADFLTARNAIVLLPVSLMIVQAAIFSRPAPSTDATANEAIRGSATSRTTVTPPLKNSSSPAHQTSESQAASIALAELAGGLNKPQALDYHSPSNKLVMAEQSAPEGRYQLELIAADGAHSRFSGLSILTSKVSIAAARDRRGGFVPGEVLATTDAPGAIARVSADGSSVKNPWVTLSKENIVLSALCIDQWGTFKSNLIAASETGQVWQIDSSGKAGLLAELHTPIEGLTTVPEDGARYGDLSGKILAGAKKLGGIYAIDSQGKSTYINLPVYHRSRTGRRKGYAWPRRRSHSNRPGGTATAASRRRAEPRRRFWPSR